MLEQYAAGRSLREIAELTDRSWLAVRKILEKHQVRRRDRGASAVESTGPDQSTVESFRRRCGDNSAASTP